VQDTASLPLVLEFVGVTEPKRKPLCQSSTPLPLVLELAGILLE